MRNRGNLASRNAKWRKRDAAILFGRTLIAVLAIAGLFALGRSNDAPERGPMIVRPATEVEKITHDLQTAFEMDRLNASPSASPQGNGWGSD